MTYTEKNTKYWNDEYKADNVDHAAFRVSGRILRPDFDLPSHQENNLDFGCGTGATVNYYNTLGFKSYGVDSSNTAIKIAQKKYPHLVKNFILIDPLPQKKP